MTMLMDPEKAEKVRSSVKDKILSRKFSINKEDIVSFQEHLNSNSIKAWAMAYVQTRVIGSAPKTVAAKKRDFGLFFEFFEQEVGSDHLDNWTPSVSKAFQSYLSNKDYKATTVNRTIATVKNFARWVDKQRPFMAGSPFEGVRDIQIEEPAWKGLNSRQIMRLKSACEQRLKACDRADQNPLLEMAVFYTLLHTGLREFGLCSLKVKQYHSRGFHDVTRKGSRIVKKIPVPAEAREVLDKYLKSRGELNNYDSLFIGRYGRGITPQDVARMCARIANQALAHLPEEDHFRFTPHMLRHTFLKRVADKHGVHVAQQMSGNISIKEVFRYTKPSSEEMEEVAEEVYL